MTFEESALRTSALCTSGSGTFTDDLLGRKRFPRHFPGPFCFSLYPTGTEIPAQVKCNRTGRNGPTQFGRLSSYAHGAMARTQDGRRQNPGSTRCGRVQTLTRVNHGFIARRSNDTGYSYTVRRRTRRTSICDRDSSHRVRFPRARALCSRPQLYFISKNSWWRSPITASTNKRSYPLSPSRSTRYSEPRRSDRPACANLEIAHHDRTRPYDA